MYLADRRYDMLPAVLSANVCSLLSNVNRFVYFVVPHYCPSLQWALIRVLFQVCSEHYLGARQRLCCH